MLGQGKSLHAYHQHQAGAKCEEAQRQKKRVVGQSKLSDLWKKPMLPQPPRAPTLANDSGLPVASLIVSLSAIPSAPSSKANVDDSPTSTVPRLTTLLHAATICPGVELDWPGLTLRQYPWQLHEFDHLSFKPEHFGDHGELWIRSKTCHQVPRSGKAYPPCLSLNSSSEVENLHTRAQSLHTSMNYRYYSYDQPSDTLHRKNAEKDVYRLEVCSVFDSESPWVLLLILSVLPQLLNLGKKYATITGQISDHERFLDVAARSDNDGLGRLVKVAIKNKRGVREIVHRQELALRSLYKVKGFTVC